VKYADLLAFACSSDAPEGMCWAGRSVSGKSDAYASTRLSAFGHSEQTPNSALVASVWRDHRSAMGQRPPFAPSHWNLSARSFGSFSVALSQDVPPNRMGKTAQNTTFPFKRGLAKPRSPDAPLPKRALGAVLAGVIGSNDAFFSGH